MLSIYILLLGVFLTICMFTNRITPVGPAPIAASVAAVVAAAAAVDPNAPAPSLVTSLSTT